MGVRVATLTFFLVLVNFLDKTIGCWGWFYQTDQSHKENGMDDSMCVRHPDEKLRFVCVVCTTLICRDCKLTDHEGHKTKDIDTVATDIRDRLAPEKTEVDKRLNYAKQLRVNVRYSLATFDESIEETKSAINKKLDAVIEWANTYRLITEKKIRELVSAGKDDMGSVAEYLDQHIEYFNQMNTAMTKALEDGANDCYTVRFNVDYDKHHKGKMVTEEEMTASMPGFVTTMTSTGISPDQCQRAIEQYMGHPGLVHVVRSVPPSTHLSFVTRVPASDNPQRIVKEILPMNNGSVSVKYQDLSQSSASVTNLTVFSVEGLKILQQADDSDNLMMLEAVSNPLVLLSTKTETCQLSEEYFTSLSSETDKKRSSVVYLKREKNGSSVVCEMDHPGYGRQSTPSIVVNLDVQDALKVAGNSSGQYFAVLTNSNLVKVYTRHASSALTTFDVRSHLDQVMLTDLCFFPLEGREVLLVSDCVYNVLLAVDYLNDCVLSSFFPSPYPAPTALYVDVSGSLWIGCQGGRVVASLPPDGNDDDYDDLAEDTEGYLIPREDLYYNILALFQGPPVVTDTPPERPPRPGVPDLPPKPGISRQANVDPREIPLRPPSRLPTWKSTSHTGLQIRTLLSDQPKEDKGSFNSNDSTSAAAKSASEHSNVPVSTSQANRREVKPLRPPRVPQAISYENVQAEQLASDGEPGSERAKPGSAPALPRSKSQDQEMRGNWMPVTQKVVMKKPPPKPPKSKPLK